MLKPVMNLQTYVCRKIIYDVNTITIKTRSKSVFFVVPSCLMFVLLLVLVLFRIMFLFFFCFFLFTDVHSCDFFLAVLWAEFRI